ncbi:hypothetical protein [Streptomyces sp. NPDC053367]|uniref:hypothetical protein n=1 Tax=Streptomyces sp. NPDC053367 TaxID=3365700 RepID=UPI0037CEFC5A
MTIRDHIDSGMSDETIASVLRSRAESWNYSAEMENAAKLAANGGHLSPETRLALGFYTEGRKAAAASGRDVTGPANSTGEDRIAAAYRSLSDAS